MRHLQPEGREPELKSLETGNQGNSIQLYQESHENQDCHEIFKGTGPQKHPEERRQSKERCDGSHKNIDDFAVKMGKKEICGTEKKICRYIVGGPQEPEKEPLPHGYKNRDLNSMAGKEQGQGQKNSGAEKNTGNNNDRS